MSVFRTLVMMTLFFIDVRVKAESKDCWGQQIPCAIHSQSNQRALASEDFNVVMAKRSLLERREEKVLQLVDGQFYVSANSQVKFNTAFAQFSCGEKCKALFERSTTEVVIKSLEGQWSVKRAGDPKAYTLPSGFQIRVAAVQADGAAHMEFPQSLPWNATVQQWAKFADPSTFKSELTRFREEWKSAVESASQLQANEAARVLASHESDLAKQRARRLAIQKEEEALRELFRKKNYIDP